MPKCSWHIHWQKVLWLMQQALLKKKSFLNRTQILRNIFLSCISNPTFQNYIAKYIKICFDFKHIFFFSLFPSQILFCSTCDNSLSLIPYCRQCRMLITSLHPWLACSYILSHIFTLRFIVSQYLHIVKDG